MLYQPSSTRISESSQQAYITNRILQDGMKTLHDTGWIAVVHATGYFPRESQPGFK